MHAEEDDEIHTRGPGGRLRQHPEPSCPQFRLSRIQRLYPVEGCCVLARTPGWFMIPSIEEYREYCTTPRFQDCCWFGGAAENPGSVEGPREKSPARTEAWQPPDVVQPPLKKSG